MQHSACTFRRGNKPFIFNKVTQRQSQTVKRTVRQQRNTASQRAKTVSTKKEPAVLGKASQFYFNFTGFPFPLGPFFERKTVRCEVERNTIWTFEQTQALDFFNVFTPIRMTVIKLKSGGLWVHAPVAPTDECIRLLKELNCPVEYIILPTFAYEHKIFVGPFSRKFPKAKVYVTPYQWSFPLNLPPQFFGIFPAGELLSDDTDVPWADEISQKLFLPPSIGVGNYVRFSEVAFFHRRTRSLLVTDAVICVRDDPPDVIPASALLAQAKDGFLAQFIAGGRKREEIRRLARKGPVDDTQENRRLGWWRMSLLVLYFGPSDLLTPQESFRALSNRLFVGPVVEVLVYSKVKAAVREWVDDICSSWDFRQIIPCHFSAPIRAGPAEFRRAFAFAFNAADNDAASPAAPATARPGFLSALLGGGLGGGGSAGAGGALTRPVNFPEADMQTLNNLNNTLLRLGAVKADAEAAM